MPPKDIYSPVPTEKPAQVRGDVATPSVHVNFPDVKISGAVGEALAEVGKQGYGTLSRATAVVGHAFDSLGRSLEGAGDEIWKRAVGLQELENETKRNKAVVEFEQYVSEQRLKLNQTKGANATSINLKMFNEDLEQKRQDLRSRLPPIEQKRFDPITTAVAGRAGTHAAEHIGNEVKASALGAANAEASMGVKTITEAKTQEEATEGYRRIQEKVYGTIGPIQGWNRQQMDEAVNQKAEQGLKAMISRISDTDPTLAKKLFEANKDMLITPGVEEAIRKGIAADELRIYSRNIADRVQDANPDATLEDKLARGDKEAAKYPDQPLMQGNVRTNVKVLHHTRNEEVAEVRRQSWDKIGEGMDGIKVPDGKRPKNRDELFAQGPEYREAWPHLTERQKIEAEATMARMALGDMPKTPATEARYAALVGLHDNNPEVFRDIDLRREPLPLRDQDKLRAMQRELIKKGHNLEADPKIQSALSRVRWALPKDMTPAHSKYNEFVGVFRQGVKALEADLNYSRPLKEEEELRIARTALEKVGGLWGFFSHPFYKDITTEKIPENIRMEMMRLKPDITDEEMRDDYMRLRMRQEYQRRYGPKKKS